MTWYELLDGGFVNLDHVDALTLTGSASSWRIRAGAIGTLNCGPYSNTSDAQEATRKLISGVLPGSIV